MRSEMCVAEAIRPYHWIEMFCHYHSYCYY